MTLEMKPGLIQVMVSSTYLFQGFMNFSSSGMSVPSKCTIKITNTGPRRDPLARPSFCW